MPSLFSSCSERIQTLCKKLPKTWVEIDTLQALRVSSVLLQVKAVANGILFRQQVLEDAGVFAEGCYMDEIET